MKSNFKSSLSHVLVHEGGWANHPKDPGGATMKGVTLITFRRHFGKDKTKSDLRNITDEQLEKIYRKGYWDKCHCDDLPSGLDYAVFDAAVNSGSRRSAKWLQWSIGAVADGHIGDKTIATLRGCDAVGLCRSVTGARLAFLQKLRTWATFGGGWGKRVAMVEIISTRMADTSNRSLPPTIKKGSKGGWVLKVQSFFGVKESGKFDSVTEDALKLWQEANGLTVDGIAGKESYRAMGLIE